METRQATPNYELQALLLTLPSAFMLLLVGAALFAKFQLPFWILFAAPMVCLLACLDGIPSAWRSRFPRWAKLLLSIFQVTGAGAVCIPYVLFWLGFFDSPSIAQRMHPTSPIFRSSEHAPQSRSLLQTRRPTGSQRACSACC
jgi:hypothetical protein